jgi:hypothetical protein
MPEELNPLNQKVEHSVRMLIGDLQMQIIVLRAMLENAQSGQEQQPAVPEVRTNGARPPIT